MFNEIGIGAAIIRAAEILAKPIDNVAQSIYTLSDSADKVAEAIENKV